MVAFYDWIGDPRQGNEEKFFFALMCPEGPTAGHAHSLATSLVDATAQGYNFNVCTQVGNCHVDDARNALVARFMQSDCSHLVFIDADIIFDWKALSQLLECEEPLCGASYPYKDGSGKFPGTVAGLSYNDERDYVSIEGLPTGFMKISRTVFETIEVPTYYAKTTPGLQIGEYFRRTIENGVRIGGDIGFCKLWLAHGGKVWLLPKIVLGHTGHRTEEGCWWFERSCDDHGVWPSVRDAILEGRWDNDQVIRTAFRQWDNMNFTGNSGLLMAMMGALNNAPPGEVLELGSGLTTVWLSTTGRKVTTLEEDRAFLGKTWGVVDDFGPEYLENVTFIHAQTVEGEYQAPKEVWEKKYAFCLVDGPFARTEKHKRTDALKVDADVFLLDDCQRFGNMEVVAELEKRGYNSTLLPIPDRFVVLCSRV